MRPHLPLSLLSALLACFISPAWSAYTLDDNGETTITFGNEQYTITNPGGSSSEQTDSPGTIYMTDITAAGTYEGGYDRTLTLEGGTYASVQLWNIVGDAAETTLNGDNKFTINIGADTSLTSGFHFMFWANSLRTVTADVTLNVDENAGSLTGMTLLGDGNAGGAGVRFATTGTLTATINGGEWTGWTTGAPSEIISFALGLEGFQHTGDVNFTINGGAFTGTVSAGSARGYVDASTILGDINLTVTGGTFGSNVSLLGMGKVNYGNTEEGKNYVGRLSISGGTFNANVLGLGKGNEISVKQNASVFLDISGGIFNENVFAQGATTTISGGTFAEGKKLFAGAMVNSSTYNLTSTNMTLDMGNGSVAAMIAGGTWVETGASTLNITGSTNLTFKSRTYTGQIWGGSYINGAATAALTGNIGSTNITITGGTFDGAQISLGTYVERNNTSSALTIGEANLSIKRWNVQ